jgi:hypothetical protein
MNRRNYLLVALFLISSISGYSTHAVGDSIGRSSHQTPESTGERRRLVELRQIVSVTNRHSDSPARKTLVEIRNNTNQSLELSISGNMRYTIHIGANSSKVQTFNPGEYRFEAQIPGFPPYAGQVVFAENTDCSWEFEYTGQ